MKLSDITTGKEISRPKILMHGMDGIGKSWWANKAKKSIFLATEDGQKHLDASRLPLCKTTQDIYDALFLLAHEKHEFSTLIFDSLDWGEKIIYNDIITANHAKCIDDSNIRALSYGRGPKMSLVTWGNILSMLDGLNAQGMTIIALAHSKLKKVDNPPHPAYDRYCIDIYDKAADLWKQWADVVLYATQKIIVNETEGDFGRVHVSARSGGNRVFYTEDRPAWDAKNRYELPLEMSLDKELGCRPLLKLIYEYLREGKRETKNDESSTNNATDETQPAISRADSAREGTSNRKPRGKARSSEPAGGNNEQGNLGESGGFVEDIPFGLEEN